MAPESSACLSNAALSASQERSSCFIWSLLSRLELKCHDICTTFKPGLVACGLDVCNMGKEDKHDDISRIQWRLHQWNQCLQPFRLRCTCHCYNLPLCWNFCRDLATERPFRMNLEVRLKLHSTVSGLRDHFSIPTNLWVVIVKGLPPMYYGLNLVFLL